MTEELPEIETFTANVARLHHSSVSPNGKFGFPVTTYMGPLPQDNTWCDTWEEYFKRGMIRMLQLTDWMFVYVDLLTVVQITVTGYCCLGLWNLVQIVTVKFCKIISFACEF
jgi:Fructosamine kinase